MELKAIGVIRSPFTQAKGTPIQPAFSKGAEGLVEVYEPYTAALQDLEGFERIWVLYWYHKAAPFKPLVKPYLDTVLRGLFATRAPSRPNPIGISSVRLLTRDGSQLHVADIDILDGTPLLDIKPYVDRFDSFHTKRHGWLDTVVKRDTEADDRFFGERNTAL